MRLRMEGVHLVFYRTETSDWARLENHGRPAHTVNDDYDEIEFTVSSQLRTDTQAGLTHLLRRLSRSEKKDYVAYTVYSREKLNDTQDRVIVYAVRKTGLSKMGALGAVYEDGQIVVKEA